MTMSNGFDKGKIEAPFNSVFRILHAKIFYGRGLVKFYEDMTIFLHFLDNFCFCVIKSLRASRGITEVGIIVGKLSRRSRWFLPEEVSRVCC